MRRSRSGFRSFLCCFLNVPLLLSCLPLQVLPQAATRTQTQIATPTPTPTPTSTPSPVPGPVVVSLGRPNVWTLEQAHYLLSQMHRRNLELKSAFPGVNSLDPNTISGQRMESLKSFLGASVAYNQFNDYKTDTYLRNQKANSARKQSLIDKRDQLRADRMRTALEQEDLKLDLARLKRDGAPTADITLKDAEIASKGERLKLMDEAITVATTEIGNTSVASESLAETAPPAFESGSLPPSMLGSGFDFSEEIRKDLKLGASTVLDNHVQMQYEIIAKQLTLLRDELGPGERLIFLELPQSVYATPGKADEMMAQTWWKIEAPAAALDGTAQPPILTKYSINQAVQRINRKTALELVDQSKEGTPAKNDSKSRETEKIDAALLKMTTRDPNPMTGKIFYIEVAISDLQASPNIQSPQNKKPTEASIRIDFPENIRPLKAMDPPPLAPPPGFISPPSPHAVVSQSQIIWTPPAFKQGSYITIEAVVTRPGSQTVNAELAEWDKRIPKAATNTQASLTLSTARIRTVDLIPRQSSLNVADIHETASSLNLLGAFTLLTGVGAKVNYQRQKQLYEQYIHQTIYASAFGSGESTFGWTFGSLPGTRRLAPGLRKTYAIVVVPDNLYAIKVTGRGCYFSRRDLAPTSLSDTTTWATQNNKKKNCTNASETEFTIDIPLAAEEAETSVTRMYYEPVNPGKRSVVHLYGNGFSTQTGILINGFPLRRVVSLALQELSPSISKSGEATSGFKEQNLEEQDDIPLSPDGKNKVVQGKFEVVDSTKIVMSFQTTDASTNNPVISLITPTKTTNVNDTEIVINDSLCTADDIKTGKCLKRSNFMPCTDPAACVKEGVALVKLNARGGGRTLDKSIFEAAPTISSLTIGGFNLIGSSSGTMTAYITGTKFDMMAKAFVNGQAVTKLVFLSSGLLNVEFPCSDAEEFNVAVVSSSAHKIEKFPNPASMKITSHEIIDQRIKGNLALLTVRLNGSGFGSEQLDVTVDGSLRRLYPRSPTEVLIEFASLNQRIEIKLKNKACGDASTIVERPKIDAPALAASPQMSFDASVKVKASKGQMK